jgi:hypothetical protein
MALKTRKQYLESLKALRLNLSIGEITELLAGVNGWGELRHRHGFYLGELY